MPETVIVDPEYANIMVRCPMEGRENEPPQPLGEFMQTEVGQRVLGENLANAKELQSEGFDYYFETVTVTKEVEVIPVALTEKPLDEALVQIVQMVETGYETTEISEEIVKALVQLSELLPVSDEIQYPMEQLNEQTVEKLRSALILLGYDEPEKVLVEFFSRRDIAFLACALERIADNTSRVDRNEKTATTTHHTLFSARIETTIYRIGRAALVLLAPNLELDATQV